MYCNIDVDSTEANYAKLRTETSPKVKAKGLPKE